MSGFVFDRGATGAFTRLGGLEEQVKQSMRCALLTRQGEMALAPSFGSRLHLFLFRPLSESLVAELRAEVKRALAGENRVRVVDVDVLTDPSEPERMDLKIAFEYRQTQKPGQMRVKLHG